MLYSCGKLSNQLKGELFERLAFELQPLFSSLIKALVWRFGYTVKQNVGYNKQHLDLMPNFKQLDSRKNVKRMDFHRLNLKEEIIILC